MFPCAFIDLTDAPAMPQEDEGTPENCHQMHGEDFVVRASFPSLPEIGEGGKFAGDVYSPRDQCVAEVAFIRELNIRTMSADVAVARFRQFTWNQHAHAINAQTFLASADPVQETRLAVSAAEFGFEVSLIALHMAYGMLAIARRYALPIDHAFMSGAGAITYRESLRGYERRTLRALVDMYPLYQENRLDGSPAMERMRR